MRPDARVHTNKTTRKVGKSHLNLTTRRFLPKHNSAALIKADYMETILANVDADGRDHRSGGCCVMLIFLSVFSVPRLELLSRTRSVYPISGHPKKFKAATNIYLRRWADHLAAGRGVL